MATKNTLYVVRVGTAIPPREQAGQGDGFTYLRFCNGSEYGWADRKSALRLNQADAEAAAVLLARAMKAKGYTPPVRLVPALGGMPTGFRPERFLDPEKIS